ncbi:tripartite tricarboxylate transporter TctB family protein [Mesorhizobium sp. CAU 1732]|uniref:tripartite tricarboxylate transporter TctB family protein n=1 Tax=Mesorhizobium sp. CAU 1732 TaxID=3140358 RepID=UPI0032602735
MSETRTKGIVVGACMLAAGIAYFYVTTGLPRRGAIDAAFFPYALAILMIVLGLLQVMASWRRSPEPADAASQDEIAKATLAADSEDPDIPEGAKPDYLSVVVSLCLIAGFTALMRPLSFPVAAALYLFLQFSILSPAGKPVPHVLHAVLAVLIATFVFLLFRYGFGLMLPAGPLTPYLR